MKRFEGKVAIVTGGTRGIGRGICEAFLKEGATVLATYFGNDQAAKDFLDENAQYGERLKTFKFDVSNSVLVKEFFQSLETQFQSIDILINNSGIRKDAMTAMMEDDQWSKVLDTNLSGSFYMVREVIPLMMKNRFGRIVNISSIGGSLGLPGQANYAASKAGQMAISKSISKEVAKKGITINCVLPGFINTELLEGLEPEQVKEYKKQVPMKRFGKIEEVASAVLFLSSEEASYITGSSLEISGGL